MELQIDIRESLKREDSSDRDLREELDRFVKILSENNQHLEHGLPEVEDWKLQRKYMAEADQEPEQPKFTHFVDVSLYVRDPYDLIDAKFEKLRARLSLIVPDINLAETNGRIS